MRRDREFLLLFLAGPLVDGGGIFIGLPMDKGMTMKYIYKINRPIFSLDIEDCIKRECHEINVQS